MHVSSRQVGWDVFFPAVVYAYNTSISETTGDIPFFLTYGREPVLMTNTTMLSLVNLSSTIVFHHPRMNLVESDNSNKIPKFPDNTPNGRESLN